MIENLPERFRLAYESIEKLQSQGRYQAAFIFGSVARGEMTDESDFDVKVVTDTDSTCTNINHPFVGGVKFDLTFQSLSQLTAFTDQQIARAERVPMAAESIIVFDKTGELSELRRRAQMAQPRKAEPKDYQHLQFMIYHLDNKVTRQLNVDAAGALLSMGIGLDELAHLYYQIRGRWQVSDKRLLRDLESWDVPFAHLLRRFALVCDLQEKYALWQEMVDHVVAPMGGRQPIAENNCHCEQCQIDLANFG